jgi:hypothetical protein
MKPHALPTSIAGIALIVLSLAPRANPSFAKSQVAYRLDVRSLLPGNTDPRMVDGSNDEEQGYVAPDSVSSELPGAANLEDEPGKPVITAGNNLRRDLGLYLSDLRERGPPL